MRTPCVAALLLALADQWLQLHAAERNYDLIIENVESISDPDYFGAKTGMALRPLNTTTKPARTELSAVLEIIKPLPNDTIFGITLHELHEKRYIQSFVKYRTPLCDYLRFEKRPMFNALKTYFNVPSSCPLQGFYRMDWESRFEKASPPVTFPGPENWRVILQFTSPSHDFLKNTIKFRVDRTKAKLGRG